MQSFFGGGGGGGGPFGGGGMGGGMGGMRGGMGGMGGGPMGGMGSMGGMGGMPMGGIFQSMFGGSPMEGGMGGSMGSMGSDNDHMFGMGRGNVPVTGSGKRDANCYAEPAGPRKTEVELKLSLEVGLIRRSNLVRLRRGSIWRSDLVRSIQEACGSTDVRSGFVLVSLIAILTWCEICMTQVCMCNSQAPHLCSVSNDSFK